MDNETPQHPQEQLYSLYPNVFPPTTSSSTSSSHDDDVQPEHPAAASEDALPPDDAQDEDAFERNLREKPKTSALTIKDSLAYLTTIKTVFQDKPEVYAQFLDVMNAFKMRTVDTPGVVKRVIHLFAGHPCLIVEFNQFLPGDWRIKLNSQGGNAAHFTVVTPNEGKTEVYVIRSAPVIP